MMRLRIAKNTLNAAVAHVARAVPTRTATPIHQGMLLVVSDGQLNLSAFDPETKVSSRATVPVQDCQDGTALVPGQQLRNFVASLPDGDVDLVVEDKHALLIAGRAKFKLPLMPADDYPTLPAMPDPVATVPVAVLVEAVTQVAIAAAADHGPVPVLSGVLLEATAGKLLMVATDRYRAAVRELDWDTVDGFADFATVIPAKTLLDAVKALGKVGEVTIYRTEGVLGLSTDTRSATIGELGGEFPNWRPLFAGTATTHVTVDASELAQAANRVSLVREKDQPLLLAAEDGTVKVTATGSGTGSEGLDTVEAVLEGDPVTLGMNPGFLRDGLAGAGAGKIKIAIVNAVRPVVITGEATDGFKYLVMPMKVTG